jgi:hypothetical protein
MPPAAHFPLPLALRVHPDKPRWAIVDLPFAFLSPTLGRIEVEPGFDTDYASVPRLFWSIYPPDGSYRAAAVIHDWLYWNLATEPLGPRITREQADQVFLEALTALEIPWARRHLLHKSVRAGGWLPWLRRTRELS